MVLWKGKQGALPPPILLVVIGQLQALPLSLMDQWDLNIDR